MGGEGGGGGGAEGGGEGGRGVGRGQHPPRFWCGRRENGRFTPPNVSEEPSNTPPGSADSMERNAREFDSCGVVHSGSCHSGPVLRGAITLVV